MRFDCDGMSYDTSDMTPYETRLARTPSIYVSRCGGQVFVMNVDSTRGVMFHRAGASEIRFLAGQCSLPELLRALDDCAPNAAASARTVGQTTA